MGSGYRLKNTAKAGAAVLSHKVGRDCSVAHDELGFSWEAELTPLDSHFAKQCISFVDMRLIASDADAATWRPSLLPFKTITHRCLSRRSSMA